MITDNHGRVINYLRLAVTDRCNLRCTYCMPVQGLDWSPRKELMTYEEMLRVCSLLVKMGIEKIRITGGEPFVRKDIMYFLKALSSLKNLKALTLTTNGLLTAPFVSELKAMGIQSVNLSLDTLDEQRFFQITRRDGLAQVLETMNALIDAQIAVKVNTVVMEDQNIEDILPLVALTKSSLVTVRFIEEMPFNGGTHMSSLKWNATHILEYIREQFPKIQKIEAPMYATSLDYHIPGHKGNIGIIAAYTRSFCGSCNRLRITPTGVLRTCLYDEGKLNIKDALRQNINDNELEKKIRNAVLKKPIDGWEAQYQQTEQHALHQSMATIGG